MNAKNKSMKKIVYMSVMAFAAAATLTACKLDTVSESAMEAEIVFRTPELADASIMGIYQSFAETESYRGRFIPFYGVNSDVEWINGINVDRLQDNDKFELCTYAARPNNVQMNTDRNAWAKFYEGIERANLSIRALRNQIAGGDNLYPGIENLLGEALTLRAVFYSDLVKAWGDVPARFEPITAATMYLPRADRDVIYKQLLADLDEAASMMKWPNEAMPGDKNWKLSSTVERVNKSFVKALRARVALCAGGYGQRADGIRLSNDPELAPELMYAIAKQECTDIINQGCNTLGSFEDNFRRLCEEKTNAGQESIWEIPFSTGRGRVVYTLGVRHQTEDRHTKQTRGGINGPLPYLFYDYDVEDVRRDITCVPYDWNGGKQVLRTLKSWCFGKVRYEWMSRRVTSENDDGINWQYMRYADVLLMAAEAVNAIDGPSAAAEYLRPIVERALPSAKASAVMATATASNDAFQQAIVDQRALEFAGESIRKADLIRWNLLKTKLDEAKAKMTALAAGQDYGDKAYSTLPKYLYTKTDADNETLLIYGLNYGDTDAAGAGMSGYTRSSQWIKEDKIPEALINALYQGDPNQNQYWPVWQTFIDKSNGQLKN